MAKDFDDSDGVWRTIAGRKVFIREGQSLSSAMKQSGKFKSSKKEIKNNDNDNEKLKKEYEDALKQYEALESQLEDDAPDYLKDELNEYGKRVDELEAKLKASKNEQSKNLNDLNKERDAKFREIVDANTKRQDIYEHAGSDEAYKNLYGKDPEKNAKTELSKEDYKKFEELTNKYHEGRKELASIDKKIDEYRKNNPKENEAKEYYSKLNKQTIEKDLEERRNRLNNNYYDEKDIEKYKKFYEDGKKYYDEKFKNAEKTKSNGWAQLEKEQKQINAEAKKAGMTVEQYEKQKNLQKNYQEYVKKTLNNDEYLQANRPNEYFLKQMKESGVKTFADEIKEQSKSDYTKQLNKKLEPDDISLISITTNSSNDKYGYGFNEMLNTAKKEGLNVKSVSIGNVGQNKASIEFESGAKLDFYDLKNGKATINNASADDFGKIEKAINTYKTQSKEDVSYNFNNGGWINNNKDIKKTASTKYTGYQQYLRDRYGTENEDIVSAGNKSKSKLYQEYKDETIRRVNRERMTPGVTNIETAYKRAFEKYKKEHPNTKLNFQEFKKMTEE